MRVIKEGKKEKEITCQYCGSELAYSFEDISVSYIKSPSIFNKAYYIECPICNNSLEVERWNKE